jgi:hypothetical protein
MKSYTIIIPNTNSLLIDRILSALQPQLQAHPDGEVIIIGSDDSGLITPQPGFCFIPTGDQITCASDKRNFAMRQAGGEIFLFLDDDCLPQPDWLSRHLNWQQRGKRIVGGALDFSSSNYLQLSDNVSAFHDLLPFTKPGERSYLSTANLSVHSSVVAQAGLMEAGKNRAEDLEWTARFRQCGSTLHFDPQIVVFHDPPRRSLGSVWRHWANDAPHTLRVRLRYARLLNTPALARFRAMYLFGAPLVAAWATARTFSCSEMWRVYAHTLPLVYLTKIAWCWSAYRNFPEMEGFAL